MALEIKKSDIESLADKNLFAKDINLTSQILSVCEIALKGNYPDKINKLVERLLTDKDIFYKAKRITSKLFKLKDGKDSGNELVRLKDQIDKDSYQLIRLASQMLFLQALALNSLHCFENDDEINQEVREKGEQHLGNLRNIINESGFARTNKLSPTDSYKKLKEFHQQYDVLVSLIKKESLGKDERKKVLKYLSQAKQAFLQLNEMNIRYPDDVSNGALSHFIHACERKGGKIALYAGISAIVLGALSFVPALAPITAPLATVASVVAGGIGLAVGFKKIGESFYNLVKYKAAPTTDDIINMVCTGVGLLTAGFGALGTVAGPSIAFMTSVPDNLFSFFTTTASSSAIKQEKKDHKLKEKFTSFRFKCKHPIEQPKEEEEEEELAIIFE